jgi:hypothetical protein
MKSSHGVASQRTPGSRKERLPASLPQEVRQIAHQLLNQLTVINLCSFKLRGRWAAAGAATLSHNAESLERAVEEAMLCAERLSQAIAASAESQTKRSPPVKASEQSHNVVPLFARPR